jgi:hypothetical protein
MTVLPFSHYWQDGFDDVDIGKEVDLEDLVHQAYSAIALSQLFYSTDHSCNPASAKFATTGRSRVYLRWPHTRAHRYAQKLRLLLQPPPGIDQRLLRPDRLLAIVHAICQSSSLPRGNCESLRFGLLFSRTL